jgi:predicted phage-related endonuclease
METIEVLTQELNGHKIKIRDLQATILEIKTNISTFEQKQKEIENLVEQEIGVIKTLEFVTTLLQPLPSKQEPKSSTKSKV